MLVDEFLASVASPENLWETSPEFPRHHGSVSPEALDLVMGSARSNFGSCNG